MNKILDVTIKGKLAQTGLYKTKSQMGEDQIQNVKTTFILFALLPILGFLIVLIFTIMRKQFKIIFGIFVTMLIVSLIGAFGLVIPKIGGLFAIAAIITYILILVKMSKKYSLISLSNYLKEWRTFTNNDGRDLLTEEEAAYLTNDYQFTVFGVKIPYIKF